MKNLCVTLLPLLIAGCPINTVVGGGNTGSVTTTSGMSGATGSSVTGSGRSSGTGGTTGKGTTSGTSTGDGGSCLSLGEPCGGSAACCTGACNGVCGEAFGQECLAGNDCSSGVCDGGVCSCGSDGGGCAADQDCCDSFSCSQSTTVQGTEVGRCCRPTWAACEVSGEGSTDCCTQNCVGNLCACMPSNSGGCDNDGDCCQGKCIRDTGFQGGNTYCADGPGESCALDGQNQCYSHSCLDGRCGTCSVPNGVCATSADCCGGLTCASFTTSGLDCCVANGLSCDAGADCCSYLCSDGSCTCLSDSERCFSDHACCSGSACMPLVDAGQPSSVPWLGPGIPSGIQSACCRTDGESCVADGDCCSWSCQNQQCGCVATGGRCGLPGQVAPEGAQACCSGQCSAAGLCQ